jgi:hypothetical protein
MNDDLKYLDIAEFRKLGLVSEINRRFLHPLGLALSVRLDGIWDYRSDPEGIIFDYDQMELVTENARKVEALLAGRVGPREAALGYVVQPVGGP